MQTMIGETNPSAAKAKTETAAIDLSEENEAQEQSAEQQVPEHLPDELQVESQRSAYERNVKKVRWQQLCLQPVVLLCSGS